MLKSSYLHNLCMCSMSFFLCLFVCLSCLLMCLVYICLFLSVCHFLGLFACLSFCPVSLCLCLCLLQSVCLSLSLSLSVCVSLSLSPSPSLSYIPLFSSVTILSLIRHVKLQVFPVRVFVSVSTCLCQYAPFILFS